ncbi:preprotein translocase subunit SecG [Parapedobacter composti]|uniref:Protein-export membrane protein SecG n=1 Tax=Parapedobacter composti TaxID=623281 RepID=A0A1I1JD43_9SPHI|nr:preprotein translocase subunit SecG [Parapedobacter composti]SFC45902.1 preprotein translocase subunit SecG [Parapedobacter composti]
MQTLLIILIILASVLLSFLVLIQNPKGGGLAAGFSGGANLMGVKRTGDILEKGTWILVGAIMLFSLVMNVMEPSAGSGGSGLSDRITPTAAPAPSSPLAPVASDTAREAPASVTDTAQ